MGLTSRELPEVLAQSDQMRLLHRSSNGDAWLLVKDESGTVAVEHRPNAPSGGKPSRIGLAEFLAEGGRKPEQRELLRLIGTLVDIAPAGPETT